MTSASISLHCISFGVPFRLAAESELLIEKMLARAPFGTRTRVVPCGEVPEFTLTSLGQGPGYRLAVPKEAASEAAIEGPDLEPMLIQLARELMLLVANNAPDRVFLHAGVVGWQGRALVLPGTSFAGKTTLVAELVRAGATYYSDEYAVLDEQGWVHPYPRALQMRQPGRPEQRAVAVEDLNGRAGVEPLPVSHVAFARYKKQAQWTAEPVSGGIAVLEMLRHAIPVQRTPARVMSTLAKMMESATALRSERGEANQAARFLLDAMNPCEALR
jgi:hypothetical protein